jgi:hypothetical protein
LPGSGTMAVLTCIQYMSQHRNYTNFEVGVPPWVRGKMFVKMEIKTEPIQCNAPKMYAAELSASRNRGPASSLGVMVYACRVRLAISVNVQFGEQNFPVIPPSPPSKGGGINSGDSTFQPKDKK